jgi:hypothetical protein
MQAETRKNKRRGCIGSGKNLHPAFLHFFGDAERFFKQG